MRTTDSPTDTELWMLLAPLVFDNRAPWRRDVVEQTGMPFSRFRALRRLGERPMSGAELAERLEIDAPAASVIVSDLRDRGLVDSASDPDDGRRRIVTPTTAGRDLLAHVRTHATPAPIFTPLDDDERRELRRLLTVMTEARA